MWMNDITYKDMFIFTLKNLASEGLILEIMISIFYHAVYIYLKPSLQKRYILKPNMDKQLHAPFSAHWNYLSIPKFQWLRRLSLAMGK